MIESGQDNATKKKPCAEKNNISEEKKIKWKEYIVLKEWKEQEKEIKLEWH